MHMDVNKTLSIKHIGAKAGKFWVCKENLVRNFYIMFLFTMLPQTGKWKIWYLTFGS